MKIWELKNLNPGFGKMTGIVVRAPSEEEARLMASKSAYQEGSSTWTDHSLSTCCEVLQDGFAMVILASYAD
jgi:hypothetical protein